MVTGSAAATPALRPSAAQSLRIGRAAPYARLPKAESPSTMTDTVLSLKNAALSLHGNAGRVDILKGITLDVGRGETLGLVGPSGSGKSSLLMLMGGLERASSGQVVALGYDLSVMNEDQLARLRRDHFGVVFQSFHLIPTMTALENVAAPLELAGHPDAFKRAAEELDAVGLSDRGEH